jgi:hypothetical protein
MSTVTDFDLPITVNLATAGAVAGTTSTYTTTATTNCVINGIFGTTLAAQTNTATPTTDANTAVAFLALQPNQTCTLVLGVNTAGAIKMVQGGIIPNTVGVTTTVGAFYIAPQFPELPSDFCPLAYTVVRTAPSAAAWVPGTGSWTASGVTCTTFKNVAQLPSRPQIA